MDVPIALRPFPRWLALVVVSSLAACGSGTTSPNPDAGSTADTAPTVDTHMGTDTPTGTDVIPDVPTTAPCPSAMPAAGGACTRNGLVCAYGDDPRATCRPTATCTGGAWTLQPTTCSSLPPVTCPATLTAASGQACSPQDAYCAYEGVPCRCTNCVFYPVEHCSGPLAWACGTPNAIQGCPAGIPNQGTVCASEGLQCDYGCESNMARTCTGGVWVTSSSPGGCPISTRAVKRDITYITPSQADALAHEVRSTRLATYEYTLPGLTGRRRLGFILEDQPASFAADPEHSQVDLYGYTSMLVAAVQSQSREIDALRTEVDALRRALPPTPVRHATIHPREHQP